MFPGGVRHKGVGNPGDNNLFMVEFWGNMEKMHLQGSLIKKHIEFQAYPSKSNRFPGVLTKICLEIQGVEWLELLLLNRGCMAKKCNMPLRLTFLWQFLDR